jgi:hypothetical protein
VRWNRQNRPDPDSGSSPQQSLLHRLRGVELISVTFIHDFLALTFEELGEDGHLIDSPRLDCLVWPKVVTASGELSFGAPGYRDALCECIDAGVTAVRDDVASGMQLQFPDRSLVIKPTLDELPGPEIALLWFFDTKDWDVWRPGEDTFADLS